MNKTKILLSKGNCMVLGSQTKDMKTGAQTQVHPDTLLRWLQKQVALYDKIHIEDMGVSFKDGLAICAIIHRYRPDLIDFYNLNTENAAKNNQLAFDILEKELDIKPFIDYQAKQDLVLTDWIMLGSCFDWLDHVRILP
ncbi:Protein MICAL-3 [Harpegnathos saltator]|uniref:Protein MICAL-3 n=1 Tax=Harpegnathos saltator TaxID=610380 RepID=E2BAL8_HARSA|nr:Protein MICAL-3 [Harpegnathos saltator]